MFENELEQFRDRHRLRWVQSIDNAPGPLVTIDGKRQLLFCSNNYLNLAADARLRKAAMTAVEKWGVGAGASRLLAGSTTAHDVLENRLAKFVGCEAALLLTSGYQANVGVIPALVHEGDLILSDELNHASIIDGCRLSGAKVRIYPHRDAQACQMLLAQERGDYRRCLILTEGVFSMEGSIAPLPDLLGLAQQFDAMLYLDDAHGLGVLGKNGRGIFEHFEISFDPARVIYMATLGKALGSFGAFVAGPKSLREFLVNQARSFIFATALPAAILAAAQAAVEILEESNDLVEKLRNHSIDFSQGLRRLGFSNPSQSHPTPIQPVVVGSEKRAMDLAQNLFDRGVYVRAIRPPTVPENKCRLRFSLMAGHSPMHLQQALDALEKALQTL